MTKRISIKGGLGNQMFQYAHGRNLIFSGEKVIFDISFFKGTKASIDTDRPFLLDKFNIQENTSFKIVPENEFIILSKKILRKLGFEFEEFFQGEKYFKNIESIIRKEFILKEPFGSRAQDISGEIEKMQNTVSLHVRRGDYVSDAKTHAHHGVCGIEYYEKAISYMKEKVEFPIFFVFSDDISWVRENIKIGDVVYVSNPEIKDYEEIALMSKCKHNIIANSSFSWWGAWLNQNPDKIVIAPKQWTTSKTSDELDILPKTWIQI